jgi:hypothetical protein
VWCYLLKSVHNGPFNPFQSNFSANCILPTSYLFIPAIFLQTQPRQYNARSPIHIKTHGLTRNRKSTTCAICWPKSILHEEKHRTGSDSGAGATKTCRMSSDIGAEQKNHNVGRGPTQDRKGLIKGPTNLNTTFKILSARRVTWRKFYTESYTEHL